MSKNRMDEYLGNSKKEPSIFAGVGEGLWKNTQGAEVEDEVPSLCIVLDIFPDMEEWENCCFIDLDTKDVYGSYALGFPFTEEELVARAKEDIRAGKHEGCLMGVGNKNIANIKGIRNRNYFELSWMSQQSGMGDQLRKVDKKITIAAYNCIKKRLLEAEEGISRDQDEEGAVTGTMVDEVRRFIEEEGDS